MATYFINEDQTSPQDILGSGNTWIVKKNAVINSLTDSLYEADGLHDNKIVVEGEANANGSFASGIYTRGTHTTIEIAKTGKLSGTFGITADGDGQSITNYGLIESNNVGVSMGGEDGHFVNHGTINAGHFGFEGHQANRRTFENDGEITTDSGLSFDTKRLVAIFDKGSVLKSADLGLDTHSQTGAVAHITNHGELTSTNEDLAIAIQGQDGRELVRNAGIINGNVMLGDGADRFDGRGGKVMGGIVRGEGGNDTYVIADKHTRVFEAVGGGDDKLVVSYSMALKANNEIEEIRLAGKGNFNLHASGTDNYILGNAGSNKLFGMGGNDTLSGGRGTDFLNGGEGSDTFDFKPHMDKEIVTDFIDGIDHIGFTPGKEIVSIDDLLKHHVEDLHGDLVISGDGTEMIIRGMHKADLSAADFVS